METDSMESICNVGGGVNNRLAVVERKQHGVEVEIEAHVFGFVDTRSIRVLAEGRDESDTHLLLKNILKFASAFAHNVTGLNVPS
jgi:hypothetical protein